MNQALNTLITQYVEQHIGEFHANRILKLQQINLTKLLKRKNPYMYRAKDILTAAQMVETLASAYMSSAEESIFGNWMEGLAIFVAEQIYHGYKSAAAGVDLELDIEGVHYFISVKSGPSWSNSSSMKALKRDFVQAVRIFNTSRHNVATDCIKRCCYGNDNKEYSDSTHIKLCGEKFWTLISGQPSLYVDIIEPLGYKAKEKNDQYLQEYGKMINKFTQEFISKYCTQDGSIDWETIVKLNAKAK